MFKPVINLTTTKQPKGNFEITTRSLPNGVAGLLYSTPTVLTATGGKSPYAWGLDAGSAVLPTGLTLATTGEITGTPDIAVTPGIYTFTIKVVDSSPSPKSATKTFNIEIAASGALQIITTSLPDGTEDAGYTAPALQAVNGNVLLYSWSSANIPAGLGLSATTGVISGTITEPGDYSFTVTLSDTVTTDSQIITLHINEAETD
jgi:hypothetical protein